MGLLTGQQCYHIEKGRSTGERPFGTSVVFDLVFRIMQSPSQRGISSLTDFLGDGLSLQELEEIVGPASLGIGP